MKIFFELIIKKKNVGFCISNKKILHHQQKKWNCKLKLQNYCRIKEKISFIQLKLKKFYWKFVKVLTIFFFSVQQNRFFTSTKHFQPKCTQQTAFCCFNQFLSLGVVRQIQTSIQMLNCSLYFPFFFFLSVNLLLKWLLSK